MEPAEVRAAYDVNRALNERNGFFARARYDEWTGRNVQFNVKARQETIDRFVRITDSQGWVFGETLDHALAVLEKSRASAKNTYPVLCSTPRGES